MHVSIMTLFEVKTALRGKKLIMKYGHWLQIRSYKSRIEAIQLICITNLINYVS